MQLPPPFAVVRAGLRPLAVQLHRCRAMWLFRNSAAYLAALRQCGPGAVLLQTRDGLRIEMRNNLWDARIVRETFFERPYLRHCRLPAAPTVVDIGAYIGDFSLFAAHYLGGRVVAYEPTQENLAMLVKNVRLNGLQDRITVCHRAVGSASELTLSVERNDQEVHASSFLFAGGEKRTVPCDRLEEVFSRHELPEVDLLKIDCEGGEYEILLSAPSDLFRRIRHIVFEAHPIPDYRPQLEATTSKLRGLGFVVRNHGMIYYARGIR